MHPGSRLREHAPKATLGTGDAAPPRGGQEERVRSARVPRSLDGFLRETRAAVGLTAAAVSIMVLGGVALIGDHLWMVGRRDVLQNAADAAAIAATLELRKRPASESDAQLEAALRPVAERYARFNVLGNTAGEIDPKDIEVTLDVDRAAGTVAVSVKADVLDTLFAKWLYGYEPSGEITTRAGAERDTSKAEVVLAIDVTTSMDLNLAGNDYPDVGAGELSRMEIVRRAAHVLVDVLDPGDEEAMIAVGVVPWHIDVRLNQTMRAAWERKGWAVYPRSRTYPRPYSVGGGAGPAETWTMPSKPEEWKGCLDQRALNGPRPPGLSVALPSSASFTMAFFPVLNLTSYQCRDLSGDSFSGSFWQRCYHGPTFEQTVPPTPCPAGSGKCYQEPETSQHSCSGFAPILPLSGDMDEVRGAIDTLAPIAPQTYSTMGLIWGRRALTPRVAGGVGRYGASGGPEQERIPRGAQGDRAADRRRGQLRHRPRRHPRPPRRVHRGQARRDRGLRRRGDEPQPDRLGAVEGADGVLQPERPPGPDLRVPQQPHERGPRGRIPPDRPAAPRRAADPLMRGTTPLSSRAPAGAVEIACVRRVEATNSGGGLKPDRVTPSGRPAMHGGAAESTPALVPPAHSVALPHEGARSS